MGEGGGEKEREKKEGGENEGGGKEGEGGNGVAMRNNPRSPVKKRSIQDNACKRCNIEQCQCKVMRTFPLVQMRNAHAMG